MKHSFLTGILALAVILTGCTSINPFVKEAKDNIAATQYQAALDAANQAIEQEPGNGQAYYYKGVALGALGQEEEAAADRLPYFQDMYTAMKTAEAIFDTLEKAPSEAADIPTVLVSTWAAEHNAAVNILTSDSIAAQYEDPNLEAAAHLINAVTLAPDSAISHSVLSTAYYRAGNLEGATTSYEKVMELLEDKEVNDYEYLINLYITGKSYDKARELALEGLEVFPGTTSFVQYLADSYLQTGDVDKAVELIRQLIEKDPDNAQYHLVLGTQVYQTVSALTDEYTALLQQIYDAKQAARNLRGREKTAADARIKDLEAEAAALDAKISERTALSLEEVTISSQLDSSSPNTFNILGIIYQNESALWFQKRNNTTDNKLADQYDTKAREILQSARINYEKASELNPENTEYWRSLFQVYTTLGMMDKAEEAMQKAGL